MRNRRACLAMFLWTSLLLTALSPGFADQRCPGGCVSTIEFLGSPPMEASFNVDLQIGDFETLSPTVRRAPVRFNNITNDSLGVTLKIADSPPSYFYLESESPTGSPFFPADAHGDYYFVMQVSSPSLTLRNQNAMTVAASGLPQFPPPAPFSYTLKLPTEFTDGAGNTVIIQSGVVTIVSDVNTPPDLCTQPEATPPTCVLGSTSQGPPVSIHIDTQDTGSGLAHIDVLEKTNATVEVPSFSPGTREVQTVVATKIDQSTGSRVQLQVTDGCSNVTVCDPVVTSVIRSTGRPEVQTIGNLAQEEGSVRVLNGVPGIDNLEIEVNGAKFQVHDLAGGEERTLDISSAMRPGHGNALTLQARGKPGGSAVVLIWDGH